MAGRRGRKGNIGIADKTDRERDRQSERQTETVKCKILGPLPRADWSDTPRFPFGPCSSPPNLLMQVSLIQLHDLEKSPEEDPATEQGRTGDVLRPPGKPK